MKIASLPIVLLAGAALAFSGCTSSKAKLQTSPIFSLGIVGSDTVTEGVDSDLDTYLFADELVSRAGYVRFAVEGESAVIATSGIYIEPGEMTEISTGLWRYGPFTAVILVDDNVDNSGSVIRYTITSVDHGGVTDGGQVIWTPTDNDVTKPSLAPKSN